MAFVRDLRLDGSGGLTKGAGPRWIHLDQTDAEQAGWLRDSGDIDDVLTEAMLAEDTRPRSLVSGDALFLILRGMYLGDAAERDDMVSLRIWMEADRVITARRRRVACIGEIARSLEAGSGPHDMGELLIEIVERMLQRIGERVEEHEDHADALEETVLTGPSHEIRTRLSQLRRDCIGLRRYLAPQRETIGRLHAERVSWLTDSHRAHLRETGDRVTRLLETLDATRDRAAVTSEELSNRLAETMNQTLYTLSIVAAIFLPLGLLTGLLGINVGGMPGVNSDIAFGVVCVALVVLGLLEWAVLRRMRWV